MAELDDPLDHAKTYGDVPPLTTALAEPVAFPKHNILTPVKLMANAALGCAME